MSAPTLIRAFAFLAAAASPASVAASEWKPIERVETYAVWGRTGPDLYASIGASGPKIGIGRAIAYTDFKLTWTRDYRKEGTSCRLASARPKLIITYRLPAPSQKLPAAIKKNWDTFAAGIRAHEKVHGDIIVAMVREIEAATIGLTVPDDPGCRKIRTEMTARLSAISQAQRAKSRDFDRAEMSEGGPVHRLILALVNGG